VGLTALVCPIFKRTGIFPNRNDSAAGALGDTAEPVDLVEAGGEVELRTAGRPL
jgi:hypothetical protein